MTFLNQVAKHYVQDIASLAKTVFIFPNKRSLMHFRNELRQAAVPGTLTSVRTVSINDFFQKMYGVETTDRLRLVLSLYECYCRLNEKAEPLDEFIHWGRVMLSDFDNVDKYLVDASKVFVNVADFRGIEDTYEYLTEGQRKAIEHFVAHFRDRSGRLTVNMDIESADVKARFLRVWNLLAPLYTAFNEKLSEDKMAYEGKVYRGFAQKLLDGEDITSTLGRRYPGKEKFVFVGLNALNECEKTVLRAIRNAGQAEFVWDFSSKEIKNPRNRAAFFMKKNVEEFPQAFPLDTDGLARPHVKVVSVPSAVGQTKLAPAILSASNGKPNETVFVLADEGLMMPLLSAIPEEVETVNVTMGYPMTRSAIYSLMKAVGILQSSIRVVEDKVYFNHKSVSAIASSSLFKACVSDDEKAIMERVKTEASQYIPAETFEGETLQVIFRPVVMPDGTRVSLTTASQQQNIEMARYLKSVIETVSAHLDESDTHRVEAEFCSRYAESVDSLTAISFPVMPLTWLRTLDGLIRDESVPFEGDALEGLQVMGMLETRALDYRNVVILGANEDLFPHRSVDNSFIPPELRKGFGLPTTEYQDAVWAYYFYRLIQRAENVWLVYDSRTDGLLSGEETRYVKQLEYHFRFNIERITAVAAVKQLAEDEYIEKTPEDIEALRRGHLSASSLQSYLACPAKFYYQAVKGLKVDDEVAETMDAAMLGTVFHSVMQKLYEGKQAVTMADLRRILSEEEPLRALIRDEILHSVRALEIEGRNLVIEEVVLEYVRAAVRNDIRLLHESGSDQFRIIGLERKLKTVIDGFNFVGYADRIDSYKEGQVRIVDYKTGHVEDDDIKITDANAASVTDKLFGESNIGRPKIALQMYLYGRFAHESIVHPGETVVNSIYSTSRLLTTPLPDVEESVEFTRLVDERLSGLLGEIADTNIPFRRTCDKKTCAMCDFRSICGR